MYYKGVRKKRWSRMRRLWKYTLRPGFRFLEKRPSGPVEGGKLEVIA